MFENQSKSACPKLGEFRLSKSRKSSRTLLKQRWSLRRRVFRSLARVSETAVEIVLQQFQPSARREQRYRASLPHVARSLYLDGPFCPFLPRPSLPRRHITENQFLANAGEIFAPSVVACMGQTPFLVVKFEFLVGGWEQNLERSHYCLSYSTPACHTHTTATNQRTKLPES